MHVSHGCINSHMSGVWSHSCSTGFARRSNGVQYPNDPEHPFADLFQDPPAGVSFTNEALEKAVSDLVKTNCLGGLTFTIPIKLCRTVAKLLNVPTSLFRSDQPGHARLAAALQPHKDRVACAVAPDSRKSPIDFDDSRAPGAPALPPSPPRPVSSLPPAPRAHASRAHTVDRVGYAFHNYAVFCLGCGRQPCASVQGAALEAALCEAAAAEERSAAPWGPHLSPQAWAQQLLSSGELTKLLEQPHDVHKIAELLPTEYTAVGCSDISLAHAFALIKPAAECAKKRVAGFGDKAAILYTWLYHLTGGASFEAGEVSEPGSSSSDSGDEHSRSDCEHEPSDRPVRERMLEQPAQKSTKHTMNLFVRLERMASKHHALACDKQREGKQNRKRGREDAAREADDWLTVLENCAQYPVIWPDLCDPLTLTPRMFGPPPTFGPRESVEEGLERLRAMREKRVRVRRAYEAGDCHYPTGLF